MLSDAARALRETFSAPFRRVMWLSLGLTLLVLVLFGAGLQWALATLPEFGIGWIDTVVAIAARFLAVIVLIPLVHPVVSLVAGSLSRKGRGAH